MSEVEIGKEYILFIESKRENEKHYSVGLTHDGKVDYGLGYKPDETAKLFWESMENQYKLISKHYKAVALKECIEICEGQILMWEKRHNKPIGIIQLREEAVLYGIIEAIKQKMEEL